MAGDNFLTYGAIAIESLVVAVLLVMSVRSEKYKKTAIVVLGSLTPIVFFYFSAWIEFSRDPTDPSTRFAFYAMWIMGFGFFLICTLLGLIIAQLPKPTSMWLRYLLGTLVTLGLFIAISIST